MTTCDPLDDVLRRARERDQVALWLPGLGAVLVPAKIDADGVARPMAEHVGRVAAAVDGLRR